MKITGIELSVKNLEESIKFYKDAFGCEVILEGTSGIGKAASLKCGDLLLALFETPKIPVGIFGMTTLAPSGKIDDVLEELKANGARIVMEPTEGGIGKLAKVWDPNEISITVADGSFENSDSGKRVTHLPNKIK